MLQQEICMEAALKKCNTLEIFVKIFLSNVLPKSLSCVIKIEK